MKKILMLCAVAGFTAAIAMGGAGCSDTSNGGSGGSGGSGGAGGSGGSGGSGGTGGTGGGGTTFVFLSDPSSAFIRVDRMGMPAINTAVIGRPADNTDTTKDAYNAENPTDDVQLKHGADIIANLTAFHTALDATLTGLGLHPCSMTTMVSGLPACVAQAAPFVVPDTLKIDTTQASAFPNGRALPNPVIDVTLAVILLDLSVDPATAFASVPVDPPANDDTFKSAFPYLADPHMP